ncbi:MAG: DNA-directed RNA polymerase subunit A'' [Nanoarchaeota archaeon]|nr:DNA-directed RNA polymerase subunit A'' [Nanoarchaeota archaeon]
MSSQLFKDYHDLPENVLHDLGELIKENKIKKSDVLKILKRLRKEYEDSKISPGEAIGVITAESFGEPGTQMALNVFHFAGVAEVAVTTGLPRLIELFDARKEQSAPRTEVYLKRSLGTDSEKVKKIASLIKEVKLKDVSEEFSFNLTMFRIDIKLDRKIMREFKVTDSMIVSALNTKLKHVNVKLDSNNLKLKLDKDESLNSLYQLKEKCKCVVVRGIKGVTQVTPIKRENEFVILCKGSNLKEILGVEEVDRDRTITNNPFVVADVLGIEAARNVIMREAVDVIKDQGLDIDIRHIMLLSDVMTNLGVIKGITRSGITSEKESVLARASFETPIKHLVNASLIGEEDHLNSVIENVMLNQSVPVGTGLPGLVARMKDEVVKGKK